jgi:hypothetical protein
VCEWGWGRMWGEMYFAIVRFAQLFSLKKSFADVFRWTDTISKLSHRHRNINIDTWFSKIFDTISFQRCSACVKKAEAFGVHRFFVIKTANRQLNLRQLSHRHLALPTIEAPTFVPADSRTSHICACRHLCFRQSSYGSWITYFQRHAHPHPHPLTNSLVETISCINFLMRK